MRILIIKLSSMGDIIHTLPAVTDAMRIKNARFDWVVDPSFAEIPVWHPAVERVIPASLRGIRKFCGNFKSSVSYLRTHTYDVVIDAQGLLKSALLSAGVSTKQRVGFARPREKLATLFYNHKVNIDAIHVIEELRQLFAAAIGYKYPGGPPDYCIDFSYLTRVVEPYFVFLHGTTWESKRWPLAHWIELVRLASRQGKVRMTWANAQQHKLVTSIKERVPALIIEEPLTINRMAYLLQNAHGVVAVDTGFGHLSVALNKPTVMLFGPSNSQRVGPHGVRQKSLTAKVQCVPCQKRQCAFSQVLCMQTLEPYLVWQQLCGLMDVPLKVPQEVGEKVLV